MMSEFEDKIISTIEFHARKEHLDSFAILIGINITVEEGCLFNGDYNILSAVYEDGRLILVNELPNLSGARRMYLRHCSINGFWDDIFRRSRFYCFTVPNVLSGKWKDVEFDENSFLTKDHADCVLWIPEANLLRYNEKTKMSNIDYFNFYIRDSFRDMWSDINVINFNNLK
jgi:hypothetical protein